MHPIAQKLYDIGIVPVVAIEDADKAAALARALLEGGLPAVEITFRTACAEEAIRRIRAEVPEMLVGAGTVLTKEQVDRALDAGSAFLVSPGFNPGIVRYALERGAMMMPGTATPGEMEQAMELGLEIVKFFPAQQNGGVSALKAMAGPYRGLRWMPTGGISPQNLPEYIRFGRVLACGGSWMVPKDLIEAGAFGEITRLAAEAVRVMLGFEVKGIGLRAQNRQQAAQTARLFELAFGFSCAAGSSCLAADEGRLEILDAPGPGTHGQILVATNSVDRAAAHLGRKGWQFCESSRVTEGGRTVSICLQQEFAGFAVRLVQK